MIKYLDLKAVTAMHGDEIAEAVQRVVEGGWYLLGEEVHRFEEQYAAYIGTRHCIACSNGLDALYLTLRAWKELGVLADGDEVIVPANTYIASILAITDNNLRPVLVEPRIDTLQIDDSLIEQAITARTRAIMIVHLYGNCAYTDRIGDIASRYGLKIIEDNAQAHGCRFHSSPNADRKAQDRLTGSLGDAAAHSFYPGKNLGALGDAGAVTTDDDRLAAAIRSIANYGSSRKYVFQYCGRNCRMDELQAAALSVKLRYLDADNTRRREVASQLISGITNPRITTPSPELWSNAVWHIFPILCSDRDALQQHLSECGVATLIHYPIPPHRQECYAQAQLTLPPGNLPITERIHREELSLPCNQVMTDAEVQQVISAVNSF
ncbi:MAG: DegT/DnrJ/EryC1/StrS family aminotransferase [Muribaculaceae bacterium]